MIRTIADPALDARTPSPADSALAPMHWAIAAPFTRDAATDRWLVPFVPAGRRSFTLVPATPRPAWHARASQAAGLADWAATWKQASAAWRVSRGGVITVFPPLALAVGLRQRAAFAEKPLVAWCFNLGALHGGWKRSLARAAFARVARIVVHSRGEQARYAHWLDLPIERFRFVPLQRARIPTVEHEEQSLPFVLAMGSARRDYATFFEAVRRTRHPAVVVAAGHALDGLAIPPNVEVRCGLSAGECRRLAQRARINVVPVANADTASGQVTLVEAMRMGRAVVATRCLGSEDYVVTEENGLLVEPRSVEALVHAIARTWDDAALRARLGRNAARFTEAHCSDEAAGAALASVLDELSDRDGAGLPHGGD